MDKNGDPDFADKVYQAAKTANRYNPYDLNELVVNAPFFTLGAYTYLIHESDQISMFPYKLSNMRGLSGTRTHWMEGVVIDNQLIQDNPDMFDKGGKDGHPGFPYYRVMDVLQDIENLRDIYAQSGIESITD